MSDFYVFKWSGVPTAVYSGDVNVGTKCHVLITSLSLILN